MKFFLPKSAPFVDTNHRNELVGRDVEIIRGLSKALNLKLATTYFNNSMGYGILYDNGTATGVLDGLLQEKLTESSKIIF